MLQHMKIKVAGPDDCKTLESFRSGFRIVCVCVVCMKICRIWVSAVA